MLDLCAFNAALLDMDGTLYRGQTALAGVRELLAFFDEQQIAYACVTNNSTLTPEQYEAKLAKMGLQVSAARVITSSVATRRYLEERAPRGTRTYAIGMRGLHEALFGDGYFVLDEQRPEYVVVGLDSEATYAKFRIATLAIRAGAAFIGTNPDLTLPTEEGLLPGAGALLALLRASTGMEPTVIGKPGPTMLHAAVQLLGADPARTLVIGDRLDTDIAGGRAAGLATALVLTGVSTAAEAKTTPHTPDLIYADAPDLLAAWRGEQ